MPAPIISSSGAFETANNEVGINTSLTIAGTGPLLLVVDQRASDPAQGLRTPQLDGVDMTQVGTTNGRHSKWVAVTTAGTRTLRTQVLAGQYGAHQISWRAYQDTASSGARYGAATNTSGTSGAISSGPLTCPAGGALDAGYFHNYSSAQPVANAGTTQPAGGATRNGGNGSSWGGGTRQSTGALGWTADDVYPWSVIGLEINGDAPPVELSGTATAQGDTASGSLASGASQLSGTATGQDDSASGSIGVAPRRLLVPELRNWANMLMASTTIDNVVVIRMSDRTLAGAYTAQATDGSGNLLLQDAAFPAVGTLCMVVGFDATGVNSFRRAVQVAAAP